MTQFITINTDRRFDIDSFLKQFEVELILEMEGYDEEWDYYYLYRPGHSTSMFLIAYNRTDKLEIHIDMLASYDDYRFFPFLADSINIYLNGKSLQIEGEKLYNVYNEDWIAECIGEEIAQIKSTLTVFHKYYQELPLRSGTYVSLEQLKEYGVCLHSSTPRIYGYIQYIINNGQARTSTDEEISAEQEMFEQLSDMMVDVPQHISIGKVKSWQIDGSETWESYSREDIDLLTSMAREYHKKPSDKPFGSEKSCASDRLCGVVMNDIGTIYQEGIGVEKDGTAAVFWFREAIKNGDRLYAASNLGDLYRKGCGEIKPSLPKAFEAYMQSVDYYAMYRIGQAYEEGWIGDPNLEEAMKWYRKAAENGHHLALKRLGINKA